MTRRPAGYALLVAAATLAAATAVVQSAGVFEGAAVGALAVRPLVIRGLSTGAVLAAATGAYFVVEGAVAARVSSTRRSGDARNVLRLAFGAVAVAGVAGALADQWVGVLFSVAWSGSRSRSRSNSPSCRSWRGSTSC